MTTYDERITNREKEGSYYSVEKVIISDFKYMLKTIKDRLEKKEFTEISSALQIISSRWDVALVALAALEIPPK